MRIVTTVRDENGARYRKKICKTCGLAFYTVEAPVTKYDFSAALQACNKKYKEKRKNESII